MRRFSSDTGQHGYVLVMLVLVLVVLLGIAALALDLGRLYVLRTEMQNAADAAALAAAAELNAQEGAMERATATGKGLIQSDSHFASVNALLGEELDEDEIRFEFYCSISGEDAHCSGDADPDDANKILVPTASDYGQAHFVRVTLNPEILEEQSDRYGIDLFFLPILNVMGVDTLNFVNLTASALAGRHFYMCRYPPVMLCDPLEGAGGMKENVEPGQQILLKSGTTWAPGMFAFLDLDLFPGGGAGDAMHALADENSIPCTDPRVRAEPGGMTNKTAAGVNTRFDEYRFGLTAGEYPPAPNITSYGGYNDNPQSGPGDDGKSRWRDENLQDLDAVGSDPIDRIGNGEWDRADYFATYHSAHLPWPATWPSMSRKQVYDWEIANGYIPVEPGHAPGTADRRVMFVAVLSCDALGVSPSKIVTISEPDGFAKLFITERVEDPPDANILVEYMGWAEERDENFHAVIQLYE